jgi:hypothetical protein
MSSSHVVFDTVTRIWLNSILNTKFKKKKKTFIANTKKGWDVIVKDVDEKSWQEKYNEYTTRPKSKSLMLSASSIVNSDMVHFFF